MKKIFLLLPNAFLYLNICGVLNSTFVNVGERQVNKTICKSIDIWDVPSCIQTKLSTEIEEAKSRIVHSLLMMLIPQCNGTQKSWCSNIFLRWDLWILRNPTIHKILGVTHPSPYLLYCECIYSKTKRYVKIPAS